MITVKFAVLLVGTPVTIVTVVVPLLPGLGSGVVEETVTLLINAVFAGVVGNTFTIKVMVTVPTGIEAVLKVTLPGVALSAVQLAGRFVKLSKVVLEGKTSVTATFWAVAGPALVTVRLYVRVAPGNTVPESAVFTTERSENLGP